MKKKKKRNRLSGNQKRARNAGRGLGSAYKRAHAVLNLEFGWDELQLFRGPSGAEAYEAFVDAMAERLNSSMGIPAEAILMNRRRERTAENG